MDNEDLDSSAIAVQKQLTEAANKENDEVARALYLCTAAVLPCLFGLVRTLLVLAENKSDA